MRESRDERLTHRLVEGVDRPIPLPGRVDHFAVDTHFDHRLGKHVATVARLNEREEIDEFEWGFVVWVRAPCHEFERRLGAFELKTTRLEFLYLERKGARTIWASKF